MRTVKTFKVEDIEKFKSQMLVWSQQFSEVVWLDSNNYNQEYTSYDNVLAVDALTIQQTDYIDAFDGLKDYQSHINDWLFGYLTYDLKNDTETLISQNEDNLDFPELMFFQPKRLFLIQGNSVECHYLNVVDDELNTDIKDIHNISLSTLSISDNDIKINLRTTKDCYFDKFKTVMDHIKRGDIYEANFCQEFYAENSKIDPLAVYRKLNTISQPPFATFLKLYYKYALCASPERYLRKVGQTILSQPIKGTAKRSSNPIVDTQLKSDLERNEKERSENIMIVDLVRNDLSKTAKKGSVNVLELCKIYTFDQVHQMISTVVSEVDFSKSPVEVLRTTYPMGSMTGAPKVSAMQIIEDVEDVKRGLYSGAIGYFTPQGDFDFNVIIRTILYNESKRYVSFSVGGAITAKSNPESEYEECLIKAKAMQEALTS